MLLPSPKSVEPLALRALARIVLFFPRELLVPPPLGRRALDLELEEGLARGVHLLIAAPLDFACCLKVALALFFVS